MTTATPIRMTKGCAAQTVAAFLQPVALTASAMGFWALASGLGWTAGFAVSSGLFSHWQVWLGMAGVFQICSRTLKSFDACGTLEV